MRTYENNNLSTTYPFLSSVPFPLDFIQDIRLALKKQATKVFVTLAAHIGDTFYIQLQTQENYLGKFQTQGVWLTANNQSVFGCVKFGLQTAPQFTYHGKWEIHRACYTLPVALKGLQKAYANQALLPETQILDLQLSGDLTVRQSSDSSVLNIGRDADAHTDYSAVTVSQQTSTGIFTVNGMQVQELDLVAFGQVYISPVVELPNKNYIIYIYTDKLFPNCDASDSTSGSN